MKTELSAEQMQQLERQFCIWLHQFMCCDMTTWLPLSEEMKDVLVAHYWEQFKGRLVAE